MKNATRRKRLGYITEEQETAELLQETNGGGYTGSPDELIRYATDPVYQPTGEVYTEAAPQMEVTTTDPTATTTEPTATTTEPAKTINWPLLIAVAIGFYLVTKKS